MHAPRLARMALAVSIAIAVQTARAATLVVVTTADSGAGSLRQAVLDANGDGGSDTIIFAIPAAGVPRIALSTALPAVTAPVTIDGTTQPSAGWVELDGKATTSAAGLTLSGTGSTVRGLVINGFAAAGILIDGGGSNVVEGNRIGTDTTGTLAKSPLAYGIEISGSPDNLIGGTAPGAGNVISGNLFGIFVHRTGAISNVIAGNRIGTNAAGTAALANSSIGVWIYGGSGTLIGGADPGAGNVISGNGSDGIDVGNAFAIDTVIAGNLIGVGANGTTAIGNGGHGVRIYENAKDSTIGDVAANRIAHNNNAGVRIESGVRNATRGNAISANGGLGIDLGTTGVTANDAGDADTGANDLQNFPVLDPAFAGGSSISGTLDSTPNATFTVEVFSAGVCDASGHGEGAELLAVVSVATDGAGHGAFTAGLSRAVDASLEQLAATATDAAGSTSEFSSCTPGVLLPTTTTTTTSTSSTTTSTTVPATTSTTSTTSTTDATPTTTSTTSAGSTTTSDPGTTTTTTGAASSTTSTTTAASSSTTTTAPGTTTTSTTTAGSTTTSAPGTTTTTTSGSSTTSTTTTAPSSTTTTSAPGSTTTSLTVLPTTSTTSTTGADGTTTTTTSTTTSFTLLPTTSTTSSTDPGATTTSTTGAASTTTTSDPGASTTTTAPASTTTTTTPAAATTTTLPGCTGPDCGPSGCAVEATFDSVRCRLVVLRDELPGMSALARAEGRADRHLARAEALAAAAEARCAAARRGPARVKLRKVGRHVGAALRMVRGHYAAATVPALVESFTAGATDLLADTRALSRALSCP